jgi:transcriptional regulator with XRE-family HTH domain
MLAALGSRLRKVRVGKGMKQRQLGRLIGLDGSKIAKIEKGQINVTFMTLMAICKGLEILPSALFEEEDHRKDA